MVDVAQALGVDLRRSGVTWSMRCPNHFNGSYDKNIGNCTIEKGSYFICRACGNKGTVIDLVEQVLGLNYVETLKWLSEFSGVPIASVNEGEEYIDSYGNIIRAHRILNRQDQEFLGICNDPVMKFENITDDYYEVKKARYSTAELSKTNKVKYYVILDLIVGSPLQDLANTNYEEYQRLIKEKAMEKYQYLKEINELYAHTSLKGASEARFKEQLARLQRIYSDVGGDISDMQENFCLSLNDVDLSTVPF
jgi:hypothetical protein